MRALLAGLAVLLLPLVGCGSTATAASGTIEFGLSQSHHVVMHPTSSFGPDDTFAYVARIRSAHAIPAHSEIREYYVRVSGNGSEQPVMNDSFRLNIPVTRFVTLSGITVAMLYRVGFTAPGTYRVRLVHGNEKIAEGTFSLH